MALPAGRKGVNSKSVDHYGNVIGGGDGGSYTKQESDAKYETKTNIGGFMFREEDGQPQYKSPTGDWVNFSSGGGAPTLLWTNSAPKTDVTAGKINVDLSNVRFVLVEMICDLRDLSSIGYGLMPVQNERMYISASYQDGIYFRDVVVDSSGINVYQLYGEKVTPTTTSKSSSSKYGYINRLFAIDFNLEG